MSGLPKIPVRLMMPKEAMLTFRPAKGEFEADFTLEIPLEPFDTGLDYVSQPESPAFTLENNELPVKTIEELDGKTFNVDKGPPMSDGSVYIGSAHNPADLKTISFRRLDTDRFEITVTIHCQFDYEGVGENELVTLTTVARVQK
jgi:hypothetical protein